jgi:CheY-like chemotaxis protein
MSATILVVDDEKDFDTTVRDIFEEEIKQGEYLIDFASNGKEALEKIYASPTSIDLILTDVRMSEVDGLALINTLKTENISIKIIVFSAYVSAQDVEGFLKDNHNILEFFTKANINIDQIKSLVNQFLKLSLNSQTATSFDYSQLDMETSQFVQQQTQEIRGLMRRTAQNIVDVGAKLKQVKDKLEHGQFLKWLEAESWSRSLAVKFMQVADKFKYVNFTHLDIAPSALYLLAAPSTPEEVVEEAIQRAQTGEPIAYATAREIKQKHNQTIVEAKPKPQTVEIAKVEVPEKPQDLQENSERPLVSTSTTQFRQRNTAPAPSQFNKHEILAIRSKGAIEQEEREIARPQESVTPSTLVKPGTWWRLGDRHFLYCGNPTSSHFKTRLPDRVSLTISFPPTSNWDLNITAPANSKLVFFSTYQDLDPDTFREMLRQSLLLYSESNDTVVFSFLPEPDLPQLADRLGCRCFIAEPDPLRCEMAIAHWKKIGGTVERANELKF